MKKLLILILFFTFQLKPAQAFEKRYRKLTVVFPNTEKLQRFSQNFSCVTYWTEFESTKEYIIYLCKDLTKKEISEYFNGIEKLNFIVSEGEDNNLIFACDYLN
jgi:hypothetical protein